MNGAAAAEDSADDPVGTGVLVAGAYLTEQVLGRGGSGVVYAAKKKSSGERVALKIIFPEHCHSRQIFGRYKREAAILRRIGGEHIVRFLDFVEHEGLLAIALEHVSGTPLEGVMTERLELERAVNLCIQICRGLETAHEAGVIHRDLKPANVIVERPGQPTERARILDFGLAKVVHGEHLVTGLTERDMIFGTPEYMAPEQARGDEVDVTCDVYACGVILYEMLCGTVPFRGKTPLATMTAQLTEQLTPPRSRATDRDIPPALEAVVLRALQKEPSKRYESARALADALDAALERRVISIDGASMEGDAISDTELSLRRSQIHAAPASVRLPQVRVSPEERPAAGAVGSWMWTVVTITAVAVCIVIGVLLALSN